MASTDELLKIFSKSIYAKICGFQELSLNKTEKARIKESISDDIKKCSNFIKPVVSIAAYEKSKKINVNLLEKNWHDQPSFDTGRKNGIFHFEHMIPVLSLRSLCLEANSEIEIFHILKEKLKIAWILKEEDKKLTSLGYKSNRENPEQAYSEAMIEIKE